MKRKSKSVWLGLLIAVVCLSVLLFLSRRSMETMLTLKELPGISQEVLSAQGSLFRIEEPFHFDMRTKVGTFVATILLTRGFEDETRVVFGGDAKSLESFVNEIRLLNDKPTAAGGAVRGVSDGVESLASGLWQLARHPIDTAAALGSGGKAFADYLIATPMEKIKEDVSDAVTAFYESRASDVARSYSVNYFDLKTDHGRAVIESETNARLGGQAALELATVLVPFSKAKYAAEAGDLAGDLAKSAKIADRLAQSGSLSQKELKLAKGLRFFPATYEQMMATAQRLQHALKPRKFVAPVAQVGKAATSDYKATFFGKNPELRGRVVVHHGVEKDVLKRYPGLFTDSEIHSLENLRGIPNNLDSMLHKSWIRREWNEFYRQHPASTTTREQFLSKASEIDQKFGHLFEPKLL